MNSNQYGQYYAQASFNYDHFKYYGYQPSNYYTMQYDYGNNHHSSRNSLSPVNLNNSYASLSSSMNSFIASPGSENIHYSSSYPAYANTQFVNESQSQFFVSPMNYHAEPQQSQQIKQQNNNSKQKHVTKELGNLGNCNFNLIRLFIEFIEFVI
jgi:hypothetical protein